MAGRNNFVDECRPVVGPLLLQDRYKDEIEFIEEGSLRFERFFGA
jgi:hypothetical protein